MDDLKEKFKSLLKKQGSKSAFSGQGHRLGSDDAAARRPAQATPAGHSHGSSKPAHASNLPQQRNQHSTHVQPRAQGTTQPAQQQPAAASTSSVAADAIHPGQELKPATEFSPFTAVIGGGAACTTVKMNPNIQTVASSSTSSAREAVQGSWQAADKHIQPSAGRQQSSTAASNGASAKVPAEVLDEMQHSLALIASQPQAVAGSKAVLQKLLSNLLAAPQEAKYRQIRLGPDPNPKIQAAVLDVSGALDFLQACGFEVHTDEANDPAADQYAYFLDDAKLPYVESGLSQLLVALQTSEQQAPAQHQQHLDTVSAASSGRPIGAAIDPHVVPAGAAGAAVPAGGSTGTSSVAAVPAAATRNTLVLLPAAPDTDVPAWFFERTAAEVKADFTALLRRRQASEVIASKAWKDLQRVGTSSTAKQARIVTLRVRFPEGVCLQGCFGVQESVTAVFDWVTTSLRDPGLSYELVTPGRRPLPPSAAVGQADLAGAVLNFRCLSLETQRGYLVDAAGHQVPFLSDAVLAQAQAD